MWNGYQAVKTVIVTNRAEGIILALYGTIFTFFGGPFFLSLVCLEAIRMFGWEQSKKHFAVLRANFERLRGANKNDDNRATGLYATFLLFLRKTNPDNLFNAIRGIAMAFFAVVAVLQFRLAQVLAAGISLGKIAYKHSRELWLPILQKDQPEEYHAWLDFALLATCRISGIVVAWTLRSLIINFYSAFYGASLVLKSCQIYLPTLFRENGWASVVVMYLLACSGFYLQHTYELILPFPFSTVILPLFLFDSSLRMLVA
eukprot:TRINITY_DN7120_c0_g1_i1.p1 TRINITY_DN7120_c0_g1~~TRINITY_DN7120_c0_g1_i1.p1  ORF type:complete len:259 (+),score=23.50 TRINITY_DN7120_c0_g1_i1:277-1053(+)